MSMFTRSLLGAAIAASLTLTAVSGVSVANSVPVTGVAAVAPATVQTVASTRKCASKADFRRLRYGASVQQATHVLHSQGRITKWRLVQDGRGHERLLLAKQYRICKNRTGFVVVAFITDPEAYFMQPVTLRVLAKKWVRR